MSRYIREVKGVKRRSIAEKPDRSDVANLPRFRHHISKSIVIFLINFTTLHLFLRQKATAGVFFSMNLRFRNNVQIVPERTTPKFNIGVGAKDSRCYFMYQPLPTVRMYMWRKRRISIVYHSRSFLTYMPPDFRCAHTSLGPFWSQRKSTRYSTPLPPRAV